MVSLTLDTNIWIAFIAKDNSFGLLEQLIEKKSKGEIILLSNEIIIDEWNRNKEQTIKNVTNQIKGNFISAKKLSNYLENQDKIDFLNYLNSICSQKQQQINLAINRIEQTEELIKSCEMTPVTNEMKIKVTDWALKKRAPFKKKANSVGDALILLSSIEYWKTKTIGITDSIFVSDNHEDYSDGENIDDIHKDLRELIAGANMTFTRNIGEALNLAPQLTKEIGDYIDYNLEDWIEWQAEIARGR